MRLVHQLTALSLFLAVSGMLMAQEGGDDNPKLNTHLGLPISAPLNPMAHFSGPGAGLTYGAGYNFNRRHGVTAEFMWDWLNPGSGAITPIQVALNRNDITGHSHLYAFTGNYRYELRGQTLGVYFIAGGGWYLRRSSLTNVVLTGSTTTTCNTEAWLWWGYTCTTGQGTASHTIVSASSSALGGNAGLGFTVRVGDAPYRMYLESRYHYAPNRNINTQLVIVTVGIRY